MELSVRTARRGAARAADVLNTLPLAALLGNAQLRGSDVPDRPA
jgi:hypothetical protein